MKRREIIRGVSCYESRDDSSITLSFLDENGHGRELIIPAEDVIRMMTSGMDALRKKRSGR